MLQGRDQGDGSDWKVKEELNGMLYVAACLSEKLPRASFDALAPLSFLLLVLNHNNLAKYSHFRRAHPSSLYSKPPTTHANMDEK